jgi:hypothetical protein
MVPFQLLSQLQSQRLATSKASQHPKPFREAFFSRPEKHSPASQSRFGVLVPDPSLRRWYDADALPSPSTTRCETSTE